MLRHASPLALASLAALALVAFAPSARAQSTPDAGDTADAAAPELQPANTAQPAPDESHAAAPTAPSATAPTTAAAPPATTTTTTTTAPVSSAPSTPAAVVQPASHATLTLGGWVEAFYQYNFNQPSNGITNFRGFDNRHNSFTLANVALDAAFSYQSVSGHITLQYGATPQTYYLAEPSLAGSSGANATGPAVWNFLQQANIGWRAPVGRGLLFEAGLFTSPVGCEGFAIKDQWNWSRSNLFFGLPFYHTGVRATYPFTDRLSLSIAGYNGWNSVVDNNPEKSIAAQLTYAIPDTLSFSLVYFGGVERNTTDASGMVRVDRPWRHLIDTYVQWFVSRRLALMAELDGGLEQGNQFGVPGWISAALYARVKVTDWFYIAGRGDFFYEWVPTNESAIFWGGVPWVSSGTLTLDFHPHDNVSLRVEYRHDASGNGPMGSGFEQGLFFRGDVHTDMTTGAFITNAASQDTLTIGATTWF